MTEYQRSRILSESPQHGPVLLGELDKAEAELAEAIADGDKKEGAINLAIKMEKERDLALAQLGDARKVVEHCKYAMIDPDGPLYGVDSKLIDEVVEGLRNSLDDIRIAAEFGAAHPKTLQVIHSYALAALARLTPGKEGRP